MTRMIKTKMEDCSWSMTIVVSMMNTVVFLEETSVGIFRWLTLLLGKLPRRFESESL